MPAPVFLSYIPKTHKGFNLSFRKLFPKPSDVNAEARPSEIPHKNGAAAEKRYARLPSRVFLLVRRVKRDYSQSNCECASLRAYRPNGSINQKANVERR